MYAVGLMSGTSLDGIDAVLCKIEGVGKNTKVEQLFFETYSLTQEIKDKIQKCCQNKASTELICSLNFEFGVILGKAAKSIIDKAKIPYKEIAFVASHGQTIYHIPKNKKILLLVHYKLVNLQKLLGYVIVQLLVILEPKIWL